MFPGDVSTREKRGPFSLWWKHHPGLNQIPPPTALFSLPNLSLASTSFTCSPLSLLSYPLYLFSHLPFLLHSQAGAASSSATGVSGNPARCGAGLWQPTRCGGQQRARQGPDGGHGSSGRRSHDPGGRRG
jgi:hypothetical protein